MRTTDQAIIAPMAYNLTTVSERSSESTQERCLYQPGMIMEGFQEEAVLKLKGEE